MMRAFYIAATVCFATATALTCTGVRLQKSVPLSHSRDAGVCDPTLTDAKTDIGIASGGMQIVDTILQGVADFVPVPGLGLAISATLNGLLGGVSGVLGDLDNCPAGTDYGPALADIQKQLGTINDGILKLTAMAQNLLNEVANLFFNHDITSYQKTLNKLSEQYKMYSDELTNPHNNARNGTVLSQLNSFCLTTYNPLQSLEDLKVDLHSVNIVTLTSWDLPAVTKLTQKIMSIATGLAAMEGVCLGLTVGEWERPYYINETLCQITDISNVFVEASTTIQQNFYIGTSGNSPLATDIQQQLPNYSTEGPMALYLLAQGLYGYIATKYSFCDWFVAVVDTRRYKDYYIGGVTVGWITGYGVLNVTENRSVMFGWYNQVMNQTSPCVANLLRDFKCCGTATTGSDCGLLFTRRVNAFCEQTHSHSYLVFRAPDNNTPGEGSNNLAISSDWCTVASIRYYSNITVPSTSVQNAFRTKLHRNLTDVGRRKV